MWYTIQTGDTLSLLAQRYLNSIMLFNDIFEQNRDTINDINIIVPGMKIWIPINGLDRPDLAPAAPFVPYVAPSYPEVTPYQSTFETTSQTQASVPITSGFLNMTNFNKEKLMMYGGVGLVGIAALIALLK